MNGGHSSSLDDNERRRRQQDKKLQAPPLMLSGGDAELPAADTSALAAMALGMGMDMNSPSDGTYATAMQPQGGGTSNSSAGPSLVYGHISATGLLVDTSSPELGNDMTENSFNQGQGQSQFVQQLVPSASRLLQQSTAGTNNNMATDPQAQDDGTAAFTAQDEQLELATVSPTELADADTDLRGIVSQFDCLNMSSGSTSANQRVHITPAQLHQLSAVETRSHLGHIGPALLRLDQEIAALPPEDKADYLLAMRRCPPTSVAMTTAQEPWDCYRTAYLEREGYNPAAAAQKLCKYWRIKRSTFGTEAYCPYASTGPTGTGDMTLAQCFSESEMANIIDHNICHVLDERDGAGRAILFLDPSRRDLQRFSTNSAMKSLFYMVQSLASDPVVRRRGFVVIVNMNIPSKKYDRSSIRVLIPLIYNSLPLRCRAMHIINPSTISYYVILPVVKYFLGREMRLRFKAHYGGPETTARSLAEYRLFRDVLPTEVGGTAAIDREAWLENRLMIEGELIRQCQQKYQLQVQQQQLQQQQMAQNIEQDLSDMGYNLADFEPNPIGAIGSSTELDGTLGNLMDSADFQRVDYVHSGQKRGSESFGYEFSDDVAQQVFTDGDHELKKRRSESEMMEAALAVDQDIQSSEFALANEDFGSFEATASTPSQPPFDSSDTNDKTKSRKKNANKAKAKKPVGIKGGRASDPRMVAAIEAKTRDNNLSLRDALEAGGFEFPHTEVRCPAAAVVDSDGVSLAQRKNQLSRRLRQIKEAQAEKGKAGGHVGQSSQSEEEA